jgi:hypothetical protein
LPVPEAEKEMVMIKIIVLALLWVPCTAFASDCRIIEYADHFEATCIGDSERSPVQAQNAEPIRVEWEQVATIAQAQISDAELPDIAPEHIVRNDLARLHGEYWLKTQGR